MQPALMHYRLRRIARAQRNALAERDVEFKPEKEAETLLRDQEQSTTEASSPLRSDLSPIQCAGESQYSDEPKRESVPTSSKSDVESGLSNTILEDGGDFDKEVKSPVTSGVFTPDLGQFLQQSCKITG